MLGWVVWLTGLPGSGKSTITRFLAKKLRNRNVKVQILSSDMLRRILTPKPTYTEEERDIVYGTLVLIAKLLSDNGVNVLIDATGNRRKYRNNARRKIKKFVEVYVKCPLDICVTREKKRKKTFGAPVGVYAKALSGKSSTVPGFGVPYEEPLHPEVVVETDKLNPKKCAEKIFLFIRKKYGL